MMPGAFFIGRSAKQCAIHNMNAKVAQLWIEGFSHNTCIKPFWKAHSVRIVSVPLWAHKRSKIVLL